jgi:hypothetical protein
MIWNLALRSDSYIVTNIEVIRPDSLSKTGAGIGFSCDRDLTPQAIARLIRFIESRYDVTFHFSANGTAPPQLAELYGHTSQWRQMFCVSDSIADLSSRVMELKRRDPEDRFGIRYQPAEEALSEFVRSCTEAVGKIRKAGLQ